MKFNREELIEKLAVVMPGIDKKQTVEQMSRFIFTGKEIITYNNAISIACPMESNFKASIHAETLLKLLKKLKKEDISITLKKDMLNIGGKTTKAALSTQVEDQLADVLTKLHAEIAKGKWHLLPKDFIEGLSLCAFSASQDPEKGTQTCIKVKGNTVTCGDRSRVSRYVLEKPIKDFMFQASVVDDLKKYNVVKYCLTKSWLHFKTKDNIIFSCRPVAGDFIDYDKLFEGFKGIKFKIPNELLEIISTVGVITEENLARDRKMDITLENDTLTCRAETPEGWIEKTMKKVGYEKSKRSFIINPVLLTQAMQNATYLFISKDMLLLKSGKFRHFLGTK
jgi:DNA polymerase III sliding clamp (beta) subunit (PCNA family)